MQHVRLTEAIDTVASTPAHAEVWDSNQSGHSLQQHKGQFHPVQGCVMGRAVPVEKTKAGVRAVVKDQPASPESVERYLAGKFGQYLAEATKALTQLAAKLTPEELAERGYGLYEKFRPEIPLGVRGWGAAGALDLGVVEGLGKRA